MRDATGRRAYARACHVGHWDDVDELVEAVYDEFGRVSLLTKVIGGEAFDLGFEYDGFDRLSAIHYPIADELPEFWIRNVYAKNGQLRAVRSGPDDALKNEGGDGALMRA